MACNARRRDDIREPEKPCTVFQRTAKEPTATQKKSKHAFKNRYESYTITTNT